MQKCSANFRYGYGRTSHKSLHLPVLYKQQTKNILAENTAFLALTKKAFCFASSMKQLAYTEAMIVQLTWPTDNQTGPPWTTLAHCVTKFVVNVNFVTSVGFQGLWTNCPVGITVTKHQIFLVNIHIMFQQHNYIIFVPGTFVYRYTQRQGYSNDDKYLVWYSLQYMATVTDVIICMNIIALLVIKYQSVIFETTHTAIVVMSCKIRIQMLVY